MKNVESKLEILTAAVESLLREYDIEEEQFGFPFNLSLRKAHRELREALEEAKS